MVYEPREDSFLLAKYVRKYAKGRVLDIGTGSGVQAETALEKTKNVLAVDIDKEAVKEVRKKGIKAKVSDLFSNVNGKFDLIIFNPPYLPNEEKFKDIALDKGKVIEKFFSQAKKYLKKDGKILIVVSSLTGDIEKIMKENGFKFKCLEEQKFFFEKLLVYLVDNNSCKTKQKDLYT